MIRLSPEFVNETLRIDFDRRLKPDFHGSRIIPDAGLLADCELDDAVGLTNIVGDGLVAPRTGKNGRHALTGLFCQSVFGRLGGYEDVNDADGLRRDPAMRWLSAVGLLQSRPLPPAKWGASRRCFFLPPTGTLPRWSICQGNGSTLCMRSIRPRQSCST